jgi:hypothetical protein
MGLPSTKELEHDEQLARHMASVLKPRLLPTMRVILIETGLEMTINRQDFDPEIYKEVTSIPPKRERQRAE